MDHSDVDNLSSYKSSISKSNLIKDQYTQTNQISQQYEEQYYRYRHVIRLVF